MANLYEPGICGVIQRLNTIKGNLEGMSNNSSIGTAKTNIDSLITNINSDGWLVDPTTSAVTVTETIFFHSGGTTVGDFSVTGPKAYFSGATWVFSGTSAGWPTGLMNYISAQVSRLSKASSGTTDDGYTATTQQYSATTTNDWFTGFTKTGSTSYTGVGFTVRVTASTVTNAGPNTMSGTCSGVTTQYLATQLGFKQQMDEGADRLSALSRQLSTIQSQKGIQRSLPKIKEGMIKEIERISFIMREGSNWGVFPFNCGGNEGKTASEKRTEKDFRKVGGTNLSSGDGPQRRG